MGEGVLGCAETAEFVWAWGWLDSGEPEEGTHAAVSTYHWHSSRMSE
jgi:hypothetical protein